MLGHLALSVAMAFVYGDQDVEMAKHLDAMSLGSQSGVGLVVSYDDGTSLRVAPQPLATLSGASLGAPRTKPPTSADPGGAIDIALAELERVDADQKQLFLDEHASQYASLFAKRANASHVTVLPMRLSKPPAPGPTPHFHMHVTHCPGSPAPLELPDSPAPAWPWQPFASLALLGLAAGLARRVG